MSLERLKNKSMDELDKIRNIINIIINLLESNVVSMKNGNNEFKDKELLNFLIGNKENIVSIINKLSNLILKLKALEKEEKNGENEEKNNLTSIDLEMIRKYLDENKSANNLD